MAEFRQGQELAEVSAVDQNGQPVTDAGVIAGVRVLLVVESCARYLQQVDGLGFKDVREIDRLTNILALDVISAARCEGKRLAADARLVAGLLNIQLIHVDGVSARKGMDS